MSELRDGVELRTNDDYRTELLVDGVVVWVDGEMEPEDALLCRDLSAFVYVIKQLAAERAMLRMMAGVE